MDLLWLLEMIPFFFDYLGEKELVRFLFVSNEVGGMIKNNPVVLRMILKKKNKYLDVEDNLTFQQFCKYLYQINYYKKLRAEMFSSVFNGTLICPVKIVEDVRHLTSGRTYARKSMVKRHLQNSGLYEVWIEHNSYYIRFSEKGIAKKIQRNRQSSRHFV